MQTTRGIWCSKQPFPFYIIRDFLSYHRGWILRKHCIFLLQNPVMFKLSACKFLHSRYLPHVCVKTRGVSNRISCLIEKQMRKWKRGNHIHRLMTQEKIACFYLTENHMDIMKSKLVPANNWVFATQTVDIHSLFESILLTFSLKEANIKAWLKEVHQQLPFCL